MNEIIYDYSALRGKIREKIGTEGEFARLINRSKNYVSSVLLNKSDFSSKDIYNSTIVLDIPPDEIGHYFFTVKVHDNRT